MDSEATRELVPVSHPATILERFLVENLTNSSGDRLVDGLVLIAGINTNCPENSSPRWFALVLNENEYQQIIRTTKRRTPPTLSGTDSIQLLTSQDPAILPASILRHPNLGTGENISVALTGSALKLQEAIVIHAQEKAHSSNPIQRGLSAFRRLKVFGKLK